MTYLQLVNAVLLELNEVVITSVASTRGIQSAVKDFLIFGHGWVKVGWKFVEQEQTVSENEREILLKQAISEAENFVLEQPELSLELPSNEEIEANLPETIMRIVEDQPFVERVSPFDIYVDPEATCMEDA